MRILIIDTMYPRFLEEHYGRDPALARLPYADQWRRLMDRGFGTADAYSHNLVALGHEAHEFVVNCGPLQRMWAAEHGVRSGLLRRRRRDLILDQVQEFQPDVVYFQDLGALPDSVLGRLGHLMLVGQIASEAPPPERLRRFDLLLTSFPHFVDRFRALGIRSEYFRIGFDPRMLERIDSGAADDAVVFVGSLGRSQHSRGNDILEQAARRTAIAFWGRDSEQWPAESPIRRNYRGEAWGADMLSVLASASVALNRHIDVAAGFANNMRLYEATGVGTLLITDRGTNLSELFEPGREVVTYADVDELVERIEYYLSHDDERRTIARAGQERTLREHTYAQRMRELIGILES